MIKKVCTIRLKIFKVKVLKMGEGQKQICTNNLHENHQKVIILIKQSTDFICYSNIVTKKIIFVFFFKKFLSPNFFGSY